VRRYTALALENYIVTRFCRHADSKLQAPAPRVASGWDIRYGHQDTTSSKTAVIGVFDNVWGRTKNLTYLSTNCAGLARVWGSVHRGDQWTTCLKRSDLRSFRIYQPMLFRDL